MAYNSEARGQVDKALLDLAVEGWRLARLFTRVLNKLDAGEGARYANQVRYFMVRVEESLRGGPGCSDSFSAWISGSSAGVRLPSGSAVGSCARSRLDRASGRQGSNGVGGDCRDRDSARCLHAPR